VVWCGGVFICNRKYFLTVCCFDFIICSCVYEIVFLPEECLLVCVDVESCFEQCVSLKEGVVFVLLCGFFASVLCITLKIGLP
jgi:hypothetical protein